MISKLSTSRESVGAENKLSVRQKNKNKMAVEWQAWTRKKDHSSETCLVVTWKNSDQPIEKRELVMRLSGMQSILIFVQL